MERNAAGGAHWVFDKNVFFEFVMYQFVTHHSIENFIVKCQ